MNIKPGNKLNGKVRWLILVLAAFSFGLFGAALLWSDASSASAVSPPELDRLPPLLAKPVNNWIVCKDLGIGVVPGLPDRRQRLALCHPKGWEVKVYCTELGKPAPSLGRTCTRINKDTFRCGSGFQLLREYQLVATPTPPPTGTVTTTPTQTLTPQVPTGTPTVTPPSPSTATPTQRPRAGGPGNLESSGFFVIMDGAVALIAGILALILSKNQWKKP